MTYDELVQKVGPNGYYDAWWTKNDEYLLTTEGVVFFGGGEGEAPDIKVRINPDDTFTCWVRDYEGDTQPMWGRNWTMERNFLSMEDVHTWVMEF